MNDPYFQFAAVVFLLASPFQYYMYRSKAGYKNEAAAKFLFYRQLISGTVLSFVFLNPLVSISPTLQYAVMIGLIIASLIGTYFLEKIMLGTTKEVKE